MPENHAADCYANPHHFDAFSSACPSRKLLNDVTRRWSVLVLVALLDGTKRFGQLAETISGISDRMLSMTLQTLIEDGLVLKGEGDGAYSLSAPGVHVATESRRLLDSLYCALDGLLAQKGD